MADKTAGDPSKDLQEYDIFRDSFKYFKKKKPPPDLSTVVELSTSDSPEVERISVLQPSLPPIRGLQPWQDWKVFCHKHMPGFFYIRNPFLSGYQEYWIRRCIQDFPCKPNLCNLDAHIELSDGDNIWELSQSSDTLSSQDKTLVDRLRWVTLGYHHNWDTKLYTADRHSPFPADLDYVSRYLVDVLGLSASFKAEAAIINYYHMDSTLAPHSDHSEFNLEAPLVSFSFGQSAIMLMGTTTKADEPVPVFLHSGDIVVMSGASRLAYHAVPRIISTAARLPPWSKAEKPHSEKGTCSHHEQISTSDSKNVGGRDWSQCDSSAGDDTLLKPFINSELPQNSESQLEWFKNINSYIDESVKNSNFELFHKYLQQIRINMNVRQVFKPGETFQDT